MHTNAKLDQRSVVGKQNMNLSVQWYECENECEKVATSSAYLWHNIHHTHVKWQKR